ncbi:MAG TPA: hypothetical protein VG604_02570 [Candidatus Saccharimonadales bacterium]|nr:hypothetical protein [Candidatus Saccharimonadales bacterium]
MTTGEFSGEGQQAFSLKYPSPSVPTLPEYFRKASFNSMVPGDIVYPYAHNVVADTQTQLLYLQTNNSIDGDTINPTYFGARTGVMRLLDILPDGELADGFIADMRHIKPGDVGSSTIHLPENAPGFDLAFAANNTQSQGYRPLLAAVFTDPDGEPHFVGDERLKTHVEMLMSTVDDRTAKKDTTASTQNDGEVETVENVVECDDQLNLYDEPAYIQPELFEE